MRGKLGISVDVQWVSMTQLHMHEDFSCLNEKTDDHGIIIVTSLLHCLCKLTVV